MRILCLGLSHKTAPVAVRERLAFDGETARRALADLGERWPKAELLLLSTCNRTELYVARPVHGRPREEDMRQWLAQAAGLEAGELAEALYTLVDTEAARHLFQVAAGMDSLVPGEDQIVSQIKDAYALSGEVDVGGAVLNDLVQMAFHVAKHVRSETRISEGKVSVASVAVEFVSRVFDTLAGKSVLNVGAGKMNDLMLRHLGEMGADRIVVTNRSPQRARSLADRCGGQAQPYERLGELLEGADVVLTSTASDAPILTRAMIAAAQERRGYRPMLIVDIAVPRDVQAEAGEIENVYLYNIDDLESIVRATIRMRHAERDRAETLIQEHVAELADRFKVRYVAPTLDALYRRMQAIADEELATARNKFSSHDDAEEDTEILQRTLHRTIRRILHPCASRLRESAGTDAVRAYVAALHELFELDRVDARRKDD